MKQFELSTYGVEEMNKQELIEVDGGVAPIVVWVLKVLVSAAIGGVATYLASRALYETENETLGPETRELKQIKIHGFSKETHTDGREFVRMDSVIYIY